MHGQGTSGDRRWEMLEAQVKRLKFGIIGLVVAWAGTVGWFVLRPPSIPDVLRVERLDIVEPTGELAIVLANSERPQAATLGGQAIMAGQEEERRGVPSILFFDGKGDEVGGMQFGVRETDGGYAATRHFSFDAYRQDQTVVLHHYQDPGGSRAGLTVNDRPDRSFLDFLGQVGLEPGFSRDELNAAIAELPEAEREVLFEEFPTANRVFLGSERDGSASLILMDGQGRRRMVLRVPRDGNPSMQFLDEDGSVMWQVPTP